MPIKQHQGEYYGECDECGLGYDTHETDWKGANLQLQRRGWKWKRNLRRGRSPDQEFDLLCPECQKET